MSTAKEHGAILLRNTMAFDRQHASEFERAIFDAVEFARKNAPQLMVQVYIDEEKALCYSFQLFQDSEAILRHRQISDPNIAQVMKYCVVRSMEVYGSPMRLCGTAFSARSARLPYRSRQNLSDSSVFG
jgi:hypothetical protein